MDEEIIGKIHGLDLPGLTDNYYNLLFTDRRIVGEKIGGNAAAFLIGGAIGASIANAHHRKKSQDMNEMDPEEILSKHKKNFSIIYDDVEKVKLKKKKFKLYLVERKSIVGKKPVFYFKKKQYEDVSSILMKSLADKIV